MIISFSKFVVSSLSVRDNVVKNILFQVATVLLQLAITKFFAFLALRSNSYTSYLMFSENMIKKIMFAASRKFRPQAVLVLAFALVFSASSLYDTLLWGLDSPGYIIKSTASTAEDVSGNLLTTPSYINFISNPTRNLADININDALTGNLYKTRFNFTFSDFHLPSLSAPNITTDQPFDMTGPRIWLDDEGFSVSVDQFQSISNQVACPVQSTGSIWLWKCTFPNHNSSGMITPIYGQPLYWWSQGNLTDSRTFGFSKKDNPWLSLGTGGDTAVMKHVFTLTKGRSRHTFLETVVKISMMSFNPPRLQDKEITDLIRRTWSPNPNGPIDNVTQSIADFIVSAEGNGTSASVGSYFGSPDGTAVYAASIDLLHPTYNTTDLFGFTEVPLYSLLRILSTNITHICSETLDNPVEPLEPCQQDYENIAFGGKVTRTNCRTSLPTNQANAQFLGQLDSSAITILTDIIGDGSQNTSAAAYSTLGWNWYSANQGNIDNLLLARAITVGGDARTVTIDVKTTVPAISYLQLLLVVLPMIFALISLATMLKDHGGYYSSSFLYALSATTHLNTDSCKKVPFASAPPDIQLKYAGQHVVLQTGKGETVALVNPGDSSSYLLPAEPLLNSEKDV